LGKRSYNGAVNEKQVKPSTRTWKSIHADLSKRIIKIIERKKKMAFAKGRVLEFLPVCWQGCLPIEEKTID